MQLRHFAYTYAKNQEKVFDGVDKEALRERLYQIKKNAIDNLDALKKNAIDTFNKNGIQVFEAATVADAQKQLISLVGSRKKLVKSKSTVLTDDLQIKTLAADNGWKLTDTDTGDFLTDICGKRVDHPVSPALQLTQDEMRAALKQKYGLAVADDPVEIVMAVRNLLRRELIEAEAGLTGANALTAEGQVVLLENEGNISLVSRMPERHIVVAGIEKIVPTVEDAMHVARCASMWGAGQRWASYISVISGPSKTGDIKDRVETQIVGAQGAKEVFLILLDDWRSKFVAGEFKEMLYCINCGACLNLCPEFCIEKEPVKIMDPEKNFKCATCRFCSTNCPAKIDWYEMTLRARKRLAEKGNIPPQAKTMIENVRKYGNPFGEKGKEIKELYCC